MRRITLIIIVLVLGACSTKQVIVKPLYFTLETLPVMDGSTVTIPLDEALVATLTEKNIEEVRPYILHNKTHEAYLNLIKNKAELIFVTSPSVAEKQTAQIANIELEYVPITAGAFVFLVSKDNPIDSLTLEQVRQIYTGKITNWKEVGGDNVPIRALQRPVNSGSQTGFLDLVMKDLTPMNASQSWILDYMEGLIASVAQYDNAPDAIGYSFYYYVTDMEYNPNVKMLKINGIKPTSANITNTSYPICTAYYAVFRKDKVKDSPVRKIVDYILSNQGQQLMENAGYVKIK